jgi:mRNA interferase RelE/StbE
MNIKYTELAVDDLRRIPKQFARQILGKVSRLEHGLHGDIKRLTNFDIDYRLRCGDYRVLFDVEENSRNRSSYPVPLPGI